MKILRKSNFKLKIPLPVSAKQNLASQAILFRKLFETCFCKIRALIKKEVKGPRKQGLQPKRKSKEIPMIVMKQVLGWLPVTRCSSRQNSKTPPVQDFQSLIDML